VSGWWDGYRKRLHNPPLLAHRVLDKVDANVCGDMKQREREAMLCGSRVAVEYVVEFRGYQDVKYYVREMGVDRTRLLDMLSDAIFAMES
jgi:hypothetical protein